MTVRFSNPAAVAAPIGAYSHVAVVDPASELVYVAGQVGMNRDGDVPADPIEQYRLALKNILAILSSEGCSSEDLVHMRTYFTETVDLTAVKAARTELLNALPAATLLYVSALATPLYKVEVEAVAARPSRPGGRRGFE